MKSSILVDLPARRPAGSIFSDPLDTFWRLPVALLPGCYTLNRSMAKQGARSGPLRAIVVLPKRRKPDSVCNPQTSRPRSPGLAGDVA